MPIRDICCVELPRSSSSVIQVLNVIRYCFFVISVFLSIGTPFSYRISVWFKLERWYKTRVFGLLWSLIGTADGSLFVDSFLILNFLIQLATHQCNYSSLSVIRMFNFLNITLFLALYWWLTYIECLTCTWSYTHHAMILWQTFSFFFFQQDENVLMHPKLKSSKLQLKKQNRALSKS